MEHTLENKSQYYFNSIKLGLFLILIGVGFNRYTVPYLLFFPPPLESSLMINLVGSIEILLILSGGIIIGLRLKVPKLNWKDTLLMIGSVLITLGSCEGVARYWLGNLADKKALIEYGSYDSFLKYKVTFAPHHYLNYYPNPLYEDHSKLGYRGADFPIKKQQGEFRIITLGGSTTYSSRVSANEYTYPVQLETILKNEFHCKNIRVINGGMKGYTSHENLINLQFRALDLSPDLVIIYQGTNDVHTRLVEPESYRGDNSGYRKQWSPPLENFWDNLVLFRIIRRKLGLSHSFGIHHFVGANTAQSNLPKIDLLQKNPPIYFEKNIKSMIALAQMHDFQIMFATWAHSPYFSDYATNPAYQSAFEEHNDITRQIAQYYHVPLFDFAKIMPTEKRYWYDGRHVNDEGARYKARKFAEFIIKQQLIPSSNFE